MLEKKTFQNERLTYRLDIVAQEAIRANDAIFLRETGCRIRELRVLRLVDDSPGTTFAEILKSTGLERSLTSRIIQSLLAADLIYRENSPEDARVFFLRTTEKGKQVRRIARDLSDRLEVILTEPLSADEMAQLNGLLLRLGRWVTSAEYKESLHDACAI
jgi:DNA-binding MarR family transcriptional regulator